MTAVVTTGSTFNQYTLGTNPDIIQDNSIKTMWGENKDDAALVATVSMLARRGRFGSPIKDKTPIWAIGDYPDETSSLADALVFDDSVGTPKTVAAWKSTADTGVAGVIHLASNKFMAQDVIQIHNGTKFVIIRLGSKLADATSDYTYTIGSILATDIADAGGDVTFASAAVVQVLAPAVTYDDEARNFLNVKPDMIGNQMQRSRSTVGAGRWERGETFLADHSLEGLVRKGFKSEARKWNKFFHCSAESAAPASGSAEDYGVSGGLPYFLNPHKATSGVASTAYKGVNRVDTGTALSQRNLMRWSEELFERGSKNRLFFCSPAFATKFYEALITDISLNRPMYGTINQGFEDVWTQPTIQLPYGNLTLIVDRGLTGIGMSVFDNTTTARQGDNLNWGVAIDPEDIGIVPFIPEGEGAQTLQPKNIQEVRNNSVEEVEFDATQTLCLGDPRQHGYYALTNI